MVDNYLGTFGGVFFDVEKHEPVRLAIDQVGAVLSSIITRYREVENEISCGTSRQDNPIDTVICLFVRKIMEQLDTVNVLYSIDLFTQAQVILRSLIENIISMKFILKGDTKKGAVTYSLEYRYQEIGLGDEWFSDNSIYRKLSLENGREKQFNGGYEGYKEKKDTSEGITESQEIFQQVDRDRKIELEQKEKKVKRGKVHIQWYEVCSNVSSFYGLMKETGYKQYYQSVYGELSFETHALSSAMDISVDKNGTSLKYIRNPMRGDSIFSLVCTFSIGALKALYEYLNDGGKEKREFMAFLPDFQKKRDIATYNLDMIKNTQSRKGD